MQSIPNTLHLPESLSATFSHDADQFDETVEINITKGFRLSSFQSFEYMFTDEKMFLEAHRAV